MSYELKLDDVVKVLDLNESLYQELYANKKTQMESLFKEIENDSNNFKKGNDKLINEYSKVISMLEIAVANKLSQTHNKNNN